MSMDHIEHVVYYMLENRSFDNLLGWLYDDDNPPNRIIAHPRQAGQPFYGLREGAYANTFIDDATPHYVVKGTRKTNTPDPDPNEPYENVNRQLFGDKANPPEGQVATMEGFLRDYALVKQLYVGPPISRAEALQIMETYTPEQVSVLSGLARQYAVSDRWFSSIPTQTNCNRAFSICGTSLGQVDNRGFPLDLGLVPAKFKTPTIWDVLCANGYSSPDEWMVYYQDKVFDKWCFVESAFDIPDSDRHIAHIDAFFAAVEADQLPAFSYLEPAWLGAYLVNNGNSYHPPAEIGPGEHFLKRLYDALSHSKAWEKTLLIITFDEHGGTYDHVPPPWGAAPPWGDQLPPEGVELERGFKFNRFGVRVPTILVSPWIEAGTVFRSPTDVPYDHTSMIATLLEWKGIAKEKWGLGQRVANAPTFDEVLTRSTRREDVPAVEVAADFAEILEPKDASVNPLHADMMTRMLHDISGGAMEVEELKRHAEAIVHQSRSLEDLHKGLDAFKRKLT